MASFDPLAGSQIDVDPLLKPKRPTGIQKRRLELIQMFMGQGMDEASAAQAADQYLADYPAATGQSKPTPAPATPAPMSPQQSMEADLYAQGYSEDEARKQAQLQAELRAEREAKQLAQDLSQGGYGQRRVPSPRGIDGRSTQGTPFTSVKEAEGYESREALPNGGYAMSQKDKDMRARGMVPVIGPSGNVTYMVESVDGADAGILPGASGRRGARPDLAGKYETQYVTGLDGEQQAVLRPTAQFREQMVAQNAKIKEAQAKRKESQDVRQEAFTRLMQSRYNPMEYLGRGDINQWQQFVAAEQMLGGGGGFEVSIDPKTGERRVMVRRGAGPNDVRQADAQANRGEDVRLVGIQAQMEQAAAEREQQRQQFEARMAAEAEARAAAAVDSERRFEQQMAEIRATEARARAQIEAMTENNVRDNETARMSLESRESATQAEREAAEAAAAEREKKMQREMLLQAMESKYGPGVRELVDGWTDTPAAQDALRKIAAGSDQSITGFYNSDAVRMDAVLERLGMSDPSMRRELVNQYGLSGMTMGDGGGRSGLISGIANFFSGQYSR